MHRHFCARLLRLGLVATTLALVPGLARAADTSRIVSIGGAVTEILYGLGLDKNIVGIDTTSLYPPRAAAEKASVGYLRQLSAEGVLGLRPSLIMAIDGAGPKDTMAIIETAKIPIVRIPDTFTGEGIAEKIKIIAEATGTTERGKCMIARLHGDLDMLAKLGTGIGQRKRVMFVLSFVNGRAMASGSKTAADGIIRLAGGVNAISDYEGYKQITDEAVIAARPDVILAMQRGGPAPVTADSVFALAPFAATPAAAQRSFIAMDGLYLLGFGPRTARAARDLAVALYPTLASAKLPSETGNSGSDQCHD